MPNGASGVTSSRGSNDAVLKWTVHLAPQYPAKTAGLILFIAAAAVTGFAFVGLLALFCVPVVMAAAFAEYLFPMHYALSHESAVCRMLLKSSEIRWADVKRCYLDDLGVKLSPLDRKSRLEVFRGVYLRFAGNEDEVVETVKALRV